MRKVLLSSLLAAATLLPAGVMACDWETGEREQLVFLSWNGERLSNWVVQPGEMKAITLPNSFVLGITMDEPEAERQAERAKKFRYLPESVKITLYDLSGDHPRRLTSTYGGTNSLQGYGAKGGADRVDELGSPGVLLTLLKPVCLQTAAAPSAN